MLYTVISVGAGSRLGARHILCLILLWRFIHPENLNTKCLNFPECIWNAWEAFNHSCDLVHPDCYLKNYVLHKQSSFTDSLKPIFHIIVSDVRIVSVVPCCGQQIAGNLGDSCVVDTFSASLS